MNNKFLQVLNVLWIFIILYVSVILILYYVSATDIHTTIALYDMLQWSRMKWSSSWSTVRMEQ